MNTSLALGVLDTEPSVMRLLPPEISFRYRALPVGVDGNQVTIAMVEPGDIDARKAIQDAIGRPICYIHADPSLIDRQLHHLWPTKVPHPRIMTWFAGNNPQQIAFTKYLAGILDATVDEIARPSNSTDEMTELEKGVSLTQPDMLVFHSRHPSRLMRRIVRETQYPMQGLSSFLVVPLRPIWPIQHILLILPDSKTRSDLAVDWTEKIARREGIRVTILPVLPPVPQFYGSFLCHNLETILIGKDQLGMKLRQIAHRFKNGGIQGVFKMRDGDLVDQIREEIVFSSPDLVVMPSYLHPGLNTWMNANLPGMLFKPLSIPLLITSEGSAAHAKESALP